MNSTTEQSEQTADAVPLRELALLEALAENPEARQADLATRLGVAVGTVNWLVKRLAAKGFLKVRRIGRWQWRYLVTPRGLARKARLAQQYVSVSMGLYRSTREKAQRLLEEVKEARCTAVRLEGDSENDLVDVCRLTCLEQGVLVAGDGALDIDDRVPRLCINHRDVSLEWPEGRRHA